MAENAKISDKPANERATPDPTGGPCRPGMYRGPAGWTHEKPVITTGDMHGRGARWSEDVSLLDINYSC